MGDFWVVAEHRQRKVAESTLEMLCLGKKLAQQSGHRLTAFVMGSEVEPLAAECARWADTVIAVKDVGVPISLAEPYQLTLSPLIEERNPALVLMGHSSFGMDLAPALAAKIGAPLATNCIDLMSEPAALTIRRSLYNGKVEAVHSFPRQETIIVTACIGQFPVEECERNGVIERVDSPLKGEIDYKKFLEYVEPLVGDVDITKSRILVAVGRGIKDKANLSVVEELAQIMGGELAASRPVVDNGWLPGDRQVGVSGKTVKPEIYLALGVSGAIQHLAGMKGARKVIAINKDPSAPIFSVADYGIVDDLFKVVPLLIEKINQVKK